MDNGCWTASKDTALATSSWPHKIIALLRAGDEAAAVAQVRVAPSVRDLRALEKALASTQPAGRWPRLDAAVAESIAALSAPRLHRSP